jgi:hypothetical protein
MLVVFSAGKKIEIPDASKMIMTIRDVNMVQHQVSVDINIPNVEALKKVIRKG